MIIYNYSITNNDFQKHHLLIEFYYDYVLALIRVYVVPLYET